MLNNEKQQSRCGATKLGIPQLLFMWFLCGFQLVAVIQCTQGAVGTYWNQYWVGLFLHCIIGTNLTLQSAYLLQTASALSVRALAALSVLWRVPVCAYATAQTVTDLRIHQDLQFFPPVTAFPLASLLFPLVSEHLRSVVIKPWDDRKFFTEFKTIICFYLHPLLFPLTLYVITLRSMWTHLYRCNST